jgi:hypothetical protein
MSVAVAARRDCTRCATLLEDGDLRCCVCALPVPPLAVPGVAVARTQILRCTQCGAAVAFDANKQAPACAFCSAVMTVEQPVDPIEVATQRLPFAVDRAAATISLRSWLGKRGFFAPKTLRDEAVLESLHPLGWAAWIVDAQAAISWAADSNAGSQRSSWAPHAGQTSMKFDNITVPATRGLTFDECAQLVPHYDLSRAVAIDAPADGPDADAVLESFDAQRSAARQQVMNAIENTARARVQREIPGNTFRKVHVSVLLERQVTDRVALPAWVLAYRYRGSTYRAIIHGQNPAIVFGSSPNDPVKVVLVTLAALGGIALIVLLIAVLSG